jgi:hypothetical protein
MTARKVETPIHAYAVRDRGEGATIFIHPFETQRENGEPYQGATVSVTSTYGNWGFVWTHMGEPWHKFLISVDFDYAMSKFMGKDYRVDQPHEDNAVKMRKIIIEERRTGALNKDDARTMWDALQDPFERHESFFTEWDRRAQGLPYEHDFWEYDFTHTNPVAQPFWDRLWLQFTKQLQEYNLSDS